jgi:hypothetical protein
VRRQAVHVGAQPRELVVGEHGLATEAGLQLRDGTEEARAVAVDILPMVSSFSPCLPKP